MDHSFANAMNSNLPAEPDATMNMADESASIVETLPGEAPIVLARRRSSPPTVVGPAGAIPTQALA